MTVFGTVFNLSDIEILPVTATKPGAAQVNLNSRGQMQADICDSLAATHRTPSHRGGARLTVFRFFSVIFENYNSVLIVIVPIKKKYSNL